MYIPPNPAPTTTASNSRPIIAPFFQLPVSIHYGSPARPGRKAQLGGSKDFSNSNVWLILTELGN
jgi:hypothetical protein